MSPNRCKADGTQVLELLAEHLAQWSSSIAFPELAHLPLLHLRKFAKQCKVERFRTYSRALADALERNTAWVSQKRQQVDFSPKDAAQVNTFRQAEAAANQASSFPSNFEFSAHDNVVPFAWFSNMRQMVSAS